MALKLAMIEPLLSRGRKKERMAISCSAQANSVNCDRSAVTIFRISAFFIFKPRDLLSEYKSSREMFGIILYFCLNFADFFNLTPHVCEL
jgi:hypothetical protein